MELMTPRELADFLKISRRTVHGLVAQGKLPFLRVGHQLRFDRAAIERALESREVMRHVRGKPSQRIPMP